MPDEQTPNKDGSPSPELSNLREHNYDGIQEYDNPMPPWWLWLFYATIVFTPIYILGVHVFDFIPTYEEDLAAGQAEIALLREASEAEDEAFQVTPETMAAYIGVQEQIDAGVDLYNANCLMCHGDAGQGLIGPNLTDDYWIHGPTDADIFRVITDGVIEKGMTPWGGILAPEQRAQLVAFLRTLVGTDPPAAKAPEGDLYERDSTAP